MPNGQRGGINGQGAALAASGSDSITATADGIDDAVVVLWTLAVANGDTVDVDAVVCGPGARYCRAATVTATDGTAAVLGDVCVLRPDTSDAAQVNIDTVGDAVRLTVTGTGAYRATIRVA